MFRTFVRQRGPNVGVGHIRGEVPIKVVRTPGQGNCRTGHPHIACAQHIEAGGGLRAGLVGCPAISPTASSAPNHRKLEGRLRRTIPVPGLQLPPSAQQWAAVLLVWVGLGTLAGLTARLVLPVTHPSGPVATVVLGIAGSAVGLTALAWWLGDFRFNPISPVGFLGACTGAAALLLPYGLFACRGKGCPPSDGGSETG